MKKISLALVALLLMVLLAGCGGGSNSTDNSGGTGSGDGGGGNGTVNDDPYTRIVSFNKCRNLISNVSKLGADHFPYNVKPSGVNECKLFFDDIIYGTIESRSLGTSSAKLPVGDVWSLQMKLYKNDVYLSELWYHGYDDGNDTTPAITIPQGTGELYLGYLCVSEHDAGYGEKYVRFGFHSTDGACENVD